MTEHKFIGISKLDASKRELDHAIRLFFSYGDFVVIHLTISASKTILYDLGKKSGIVSFKDEMKKLVKPEKWNGLLKILNEPYNFFKHADKDSDKLLKFNPEVSEYEIWDAINIYQSLTKEITGLMLSFRCWFYLKHKDILNKQEDVIMWTNLSQQINLDDRSFFVELANEYETKRIAGTT